MAGIAIPVGFRQRPLPFPRAPRLVAGPDERALPWAVATLLFVTAVLNFYIFQISLVATSSYELQRLERDRDTWRARNEQLQLEIAKARSLRWVEYDAVHRLKLVRSEDPLYIVVAPTTVIDEPLLDAVDPEEPSIAEPFSDAPSEGLPIWQWLTGLFAPPAQASTD